MQQTKQALRLGVLEPGDRLPTAREVVEALAAGLMRPAEGTLRVLGSTDPAEVRHRIAYVSQDKPLYPRLTVADTLWAGRELNPGTWDRATADRIAGPLPQDAKVRTLSGGQRTRLALALALAKRPELLLLDEPMADLDPPPWPQGHGGAPMPGAG